MDTQLHTRRMEGMEGMPRPVLVELRVATRHNPPLNELASLS